ncbi:MAG TPA: septum site-determining protein Ssd [Mycobacteriales bacterium]|nr:septum site-determining protein Ssd [Mycobacteriales bacterium]
MQAPDAALPEQPAGVAATVLLLSESAELRAWTHQAVAGRDGQLQVVAPAASGWEAGWQSAGVVLVGEDIATSVARVRPPRRESVALLARSPAGAATWQAALAVGATTVLELPAALPALRDFITGATRPATTPGRVIAVIGGCGGGGASTLAAGLALTAARTAETLLIDADPLGGGLDVLLGVEHRPGLRWPDVAGQRAVDWAGAADQLLRRDQLVLLACDRSATGLPAAAAVRVLDGATRRFPLTVIDLPRALDGATARLAGGAGTVLLVVPASVRAVAAAAAVRNGLTSLGLRPSIVVRDPGFRRLSARQVGDALGLMVAAEVRSEKAVGTAAAHGEPPLRRPRGSLSVACTTLLSAVGAAA